MKSSKDLTILLLVKDRIEFSKRWLEYAVLTHQKFPIVVADGSKEDQLRHEVEKISNILDIKYIYPGPDLSISDFISKTIIALKSVQTEFTFMASDDDFYFTDAIEKSKNFLELRDDFVFCNGGGLDFSLSVRPTSKNSIFGEIRYVRKLGESESYIEDDPVTRIEHYRKTNRSQWHSVIRTKSLLRSWEIAAELKFTRYDTLENFLNLYWLAQGKSMNLDTEILLFHQVHNNMISQFLESDLLRENNEVWRLENRIVEGYISSLLNVKSIRAEVEPILVIAEEPEYIIILKYMKKLLFFASTFFKKIEYKVKERLNLEPKIDLTRLQIPDATLNQIKEIQLFLTKGKSELSDSN
jgi:glycosyltransferase domain-containing protein